MTTATTPLLVCDFFNQHGRLPRLSDPGPPPWEYRGWLLAYVMLVMETGKVPDRWTYHLKTIERGQLLDEPIPRMEFSDAHFGRGPGMKMLTKLEDIIESKHGSWSGFSMLVDWLAFGLATSSELPSLERGINEQLYAAMDVSVWLLAPSDYLGAYLAERRASGWNKSGFYPTPHSICEMMTLMTFGERPIDDGRDPRTYSVCDPAVGSGRMLLHASNFSMNLYGMDIDPLVCKICRINGALFAPWIAFSLPASIIGDRPAAPQPTTPPAAAPPQQAFDTRGQALLF